MLFYEGGKPRETAAGTRLRRAPAGPSGAKRSRGVVAGRLPLPRVPLASSYLGAFLFYPVLNMADRFFRSSQSSLTHTLHCYYYIHKDCCCCCCCFELLGQRRKIKILASAALFSSSSLGRGQRPLSGGWGGPAQPAGGCWPASLGATAGRPNFFFLDSGRLAVRK